MNMNRTDGTEKRLIRQLLFSLSLAMLIGGMPLVQAHASSQQITAIEALQHDGPSTQTAENSGTALSQHGKPHEEMASSETNSLLPSGTMGPVTLRSFLQKTEDLPVSLEQVLHLALGQNIRIEIAGENAKLARLNYRLQLSDLLPDVSAHYTQSRFVGGIQIFGGETIQIFRTTYQPQITANYSIFTGGQTIFEIQASRHRKIAQEKLSEATRQDILRQAAIAYYDLQQAYWQRGISLQAIQEAQKHVDLNQARFTAGVGLRLDLLQAQARLSERQADWVRAENQISQATEHLAQLLDLDFGINLRPGSLESTLHPLVPETTPVITLLSIAQKNNPNLQALDKLQDASKADVRIAIAALFPRVDVTAYLNGTGAQLDELANSKFVGLHASLNLLDNMGFAPGIGIKTARTQARLAAYQHQAAERILTENVTNAMVDIKALTDLIETARQTLDYAKAAYAQAYGRLEAGVGTSLDLENAATRLTQARSSLAIAFLTYNRAQVTLLSNLGVISPQTLISGYAP